MDKVIERIVRNNPTLDDAEIITTTITREDKTRAHYYIFKKKEFLNELFVRIPTHVLTKENGKGKNKHYIIVAVTEEGFETYDLNIPRNMHIEGDTVVIGNPDSHGFNITEDKINEPLPF